MRTSEAARFSDPTLVDRVIGLDTDWRNAVFKAEGLKFEFNALVKQIGALRKVRWGTG